MRTTRTTKIHAWAQDPYFPGIGKMIYFIQVTDLTHQLRYKVVKDGKKVTTIYLRKTIERKTIEKTVIPNPLIPKNFFQKTKTPEEKRLYGQFMPIKQ